MTINGGDLGPMPWASKASDLSRPRVEFIDGRYRVIYEGCELAAFKPQDDTNAFEFRNGFELGLMWGDEDD